MIFYLWINGNAPRDFTATSRQEFNQLPDIAYAYLRYLYEGPYPSATEIRQPLLYIGEAQGKARLIDAFATGGYSATWPKNALDLIDGRPILTVVLPLVDPSYQGPSDPAHSHIKSNRQITENWIRRTMNQKLKVFERVQLGLSSVVRNPSAVVVQQMTVYDLMLQGIHGTAKKKLGFGPV